MVVLTFHVTQIVAVGEENKSVTRVKIFLKAAQNHRTNQV